jgi:hypothetical protein
MIPRFLMGAAYPPERIEERAIERSKFNRRKTSADADLRRAALMKEQIRCAVVIGSRA